mgnify:CR=1 FL=1|jgi:16S rRNA U1498 N3-methylase RsmE|tara:strand:- start:277 stop:489 length:213 start_codon:yes stop_codon:yes gene_type:complete
MIFNLEIEHAEWTTLVMDAIAQAERNPTKEIYIHVATDEAYEIIDEAVYALITNGNEAAWRIVLQQHTLH